MVLGFDLHYLLQFTFYEAGQNLGQYKQTEAGLNFLVNAKKLELLKLLEDAQVRYTGKGDYECIQCLVSETNNK